MDTKLTLSFDAMIISKAKRFAENNDISLSRLIEFLLAKTTAGHYATLEDLPVSEWASMVSEGEVEYQTKKRTRKDLKNEYFSKSK